jgi:cellobiose phosphorylase
MFWDRSTLYALRGIFNAGMGDKGYKYLKEYNQKRLLGDHVPYPIEAWPEGDQRHLSAEGGLYARVIIEGMLGVSPTGFRSFSIAPAIPAGLGKVTLEKIRAFGSCFDISADRTGRGYEVKITNADGCEQVHAIPLDGSAEIVI